MSLPLHVLLVEDSPEDAELVLAELKRGGFDPVHERVEDAAAMEAALRRKPWEVVVSDYSLPHFHGLAALAVLRKSGLDLPFVLVSGKIGEEAAVEAMKAGAHDYLMKDALARLAPAIRRELAEARVRRERRRVQEELRATYAELEQRVHERTSQLSDANLRLTKEIAERARVQAERDRLSGELLQAQKLQAIGQLSAGVAHEINNPLSFMLSNLSTLKEYSQELSKLLRAAAAVIDGLGPREEFDRLRAAVERDSILADFEAALQECRHGGERIRDIVKGMKAFVRLDPQLLKAADLNQCLDDALRLCASEFQCGVEIRRDLGPLPPVLCNPQRIEQVFVNLLLNAAQAIDGKGTVSVSTRQAQDQVVARIRDSGRGIPPEHLAKLFEPFFTTKPVGKGTGLGLYVAYEIARAHGGRIEVASHPGEGTEFALWLPIRGAEPPLP